VPLLSISAGINISEPSLIRISFSKEPN